MCCRRGDPAGAHQGMGMLRKAFLAAMLWMLALPALSQAIEWPADLPPVPADKAQIVFIKPGGGVWAGLPVGILEVVGDRREMVGVLGQDSRAIATVAPGRHRFMSHMGITHFLDADVEAGKRYVVLARFIYGNGFQLRPIRPGAPGDYSTANPQFPRWLAESKPADPNHPKLRWYARKDAKVGKHQAKFQVTWERKTDDERAQLTLNPGDAL
jgi:hypothetical protein